MKRATVAACLLALAGCEKIDPNMAKRGELRRQYFVECMWLLDKFRGVRVAVNPG